MMWKVILLVTATACICGADIIDYRQCDPNIKDTMVSLDLHGCTSHPCPLRRGQNATITVKFKPIRTITKARAICYGILFGFPMPFQLPHDDACDTQISQLKCPAKKDQEHTFTTFVPVQSSYPSFKVEVKILLRDQTDRDVFCFVIPAEITD